MKLKLILSTFLLSFLQLYAQEYEISTPTKSCPHYVLLEGERLSALKKAVGYKGDFVFQKSALILSSSGFDSQSIKTLNKKKFSFSIYFFSKNSTLEFMSFKSSGVVRNDEGQEEVRFSMSYLNQREDLLKFKTTSHIVSLPELDENLNYSTVLLDKVLEEKDCFYTQFISKKN